MIPFACPFCAEQAASAPGTLWVLALLVVPFVVAAIAWRAIRNLDG